MSEVFPETPPGSPPLAAAHTYTPACAGHHPIGHPCPPSVTAGTVTWSNVPAGGPVPVTSGNAVAVAPELAAAMAEALAAEMYQAAWQVCRAAGLFIIRWEDLTDPEQPRPDEAVAVADGWRAGAQVASGRIDALRRERDDAREAFAQLAAHFSQGKQSGWSARISGTVLRRLCVMAMCELDLAEEARDAG